MEEGARGAGVGGVGRRTVLAGVLVEKKTIPILESGMVKGAMAKGAMAKGAMVLSAMAKGAAPPLSEKRPGCTTVSNSPQNHTRGRGRCFLL